MSEGSSSGNQAPMTNPVSYQISPPEEFDFSKPTEWIKWIRRFERFRSASGLSKRDEESQVNTLLYSMGSKSDDIRLTPLSLIYMALLNIVNLVSYTTK